MTFATTARNSWDPFREIERMQAEFASLFARGNDSYAPGHPPVNVWTNEEGALLSAEIPGVDPEKIDVSVVGDTVTISGSRSAEHLAEGVEFLRRERGHGDFQRSLRLPFKVASDHVEARCKDGILWVTLPKAQEARPRKIEVFAH
ncbi:MAG: Hsp20/alpha crystallin family protein [Alphaproteobacteria bacterium]